MISNVSKTNFLSTNYDIQHKITDYNEEYCCHNHKDFEILLTNCDGVIAKIDKKTYELKKHTMILLNNSDSHLFSCAKGQPFDRYSVLFKLEFLNTMSSETTNLLDCFYYRPFPDPQILELNKIEAERFIALFENIIKIVNRKTPEFFGKDLEIILKYSSLLLMVNRAYRSHHHIFSIARFTEEHNLVYKIINYINKNYEKEITLDNLSKLFDIDKFTLCKVFSKIASVSPIKYLINCRLNKAKELLQTNMTIERICYNCGFNNLSNFSKSYKAHYGLSPKAYQMKARKEKR